MQGKWILRKKAGNGRQRQLPFELAEQRRSVLREIEGLEAKIHEQTTRVLNGSPQEIWAFIHGMKAEKQQLEQRLGNCLKKAHCF